MGQAMAGRLNAAYDQGMAAWRAVHAFVTAPAPPVLAPYHAVPSPMGRIVKGAKRFGIIWIIAAIYGFFYVLLPSAFLLYLLMPIAFLGVLIIWALPDQYAPPTETMTKIFFAFIAVTFLWPNYLAIALPGLPWISMRRLFIAPVILMLLISLSVSPKFRAEMRDIMNAEPIIWKMVVAFAAVQAITIIPADQIVTAFKSFLHFQTVWTAVFFVSLYAFIKAGRIDRFFHLLCLVTIILCIMSFFELRNQKPLWAGYIPSFLQIDNDRVRGMLAGGFRNSIYRTQATFSGALTFAEYLAIVSPVMLHKCIVSRNLFSKALCIAADILILCALLFTGSRLGLVGFVIGHSSYGLLWAIRRWRMNKTSIIGPALTLAYPTILIGVWTTIMMVDGLRHRIIGNSATNSSDAARDAQWEQGIPLILKNPIGYGPARGAAALDFRNGQGEPTVDSYYLSMALDHGILGFILFYGLLVLAMVKAIDLSSRNDKGELGYALPVAMMLAVFIVIKYVLAQADNHSLIFLLVGMVVAMSYRVKKLGSSGASPALGASRT